MQAFQQLPRDITNPSGSPENRGVPGSSPGLAIARKPRVCAIHRFAQKRAQTCVGDPFKEEIHRLLREDPALTGVRVRELLEPLGCRAGKTVVDDYLREVRRQRPAKPRSCSHVAAAGRSVSRGLMRDVALPAEPRCLTADLGASGPRASRLAADRAAGAS